MVEIVAVGDIMPGGVLAGIDSNYVSQSILDILHSGDICVGTLESAIGNEPTFNKEKMIRAKDVIHTLDADLIKLKHLGVDIVTLANNHFFDLSAEGAEHAINMLDSMGIKHVGAGKNIEEASKPEVITVNGKTIAFIAFCECDEARIGWCPIATDDNPGVNPLELEYVASEIHKCRQLYDFVVVLPHWGKEAQILPTDHQFILAKSMVEAGADLILGSHTHCIQPIVRRGKAAVVYSMGNFLFPDRLITHPRSTFYSKEPLDLNSLPVIDRYNFVDTVTLKKWRTKARYGLLVKARLSEEATTASSHTVHLTDDSRLELFDGRYPFSGQLKLGRLALKSRHYPQLYQIQELLNKTKRSVRKFLAQFKKLFRFD